MDTLTPTSDREGTVHDDELSTTKKSNFLDFLNKIGFT